MENERLLEDKEREKNWKRWGPYLSERQWGTVREDYSKDGNCWESFPHDHARSRAYRWGEDGLLDVCDRQCRLCMSIALWNGKDDILKERLYGLTGPEGNHGEDCKECYYYLDSTPTHSYMKALYKYPHNRYPYADLNDVNRSRSVIDPEYEIEDTGVFDNSRYWDVFAEYAKNSPDDILCRYTIHNRGPDTATIHCLPQIFYRNTWIWGCKHEGCTMKPKISEISQYKVKCKHETLSTLIWEVDPSSCENVQTLYTENETNTQRLYGIDNYTPYTRDAFHRYVINGEADAVSPKRRGTKVAALFVHQVPPGGKVEIRTRLYPESEAPAQIFGDAFESIFKKRQHEADEFYTQIIKNPDPAEVMVARQAYAGLLWSKQFYHYIIRDWLDGDPDQPTPPEDRKWGRNREWPHLFNRDVISMPDKWEYPWYASWDLAFHMIPMADIDLEFAKQQLVLFLREWYMHPNGQIPAYEFAFSDVNPPVHAWAVMVVWRKTGPRGHRDYKFLAGCFQKLIINFTWWVNKKDPSGNNLFAGGFLGLDNIGIFDRSRPLPLNGELQQADGTAWMAFFCIIMLAQAIELAHVDPVYEDMASKFFEHFIAISDAINNFGGCGLWDEEDGFYYDHLKLASGQSVPLRTRSLVGLVPLFSCLVLDPEKMDNLPGFKKRTEWFIKNRKDLASEISFMKEGEAKRILLAIPTKPQLERVLKVVLDEEEFLSPYGIRSLSRYHQKSPFVMKVGDEEHRVEYVPGESNTYLFGGNSNWRGPIWLCMNYMLIEVLKRYHYYYGNDLLVECPTGSGQWMTLDKVARDLHQRVVNLFVPDKDGRRPCNGTSEMYKDDPFWKNLILFYEFFDGDTGRGCGASHQTGWTALVASSLQHLAEDV